LPYYQNNSHELEKGLKVPGELGPCAMDRAVVLLVCNANAGAQRVAEEVQAAAVAMATPGAPSISLCPATQMLGQPPDSSEKILMLYLNNQTFLDSGGSVSVLVKKAFDLQIPVILVHEQDAEAGGCALGEIYQRTPEELLRPPYSLMDARAIPLFPSAEHRDISLRHTLSRMGARTVRGMRAGSKQANQANAQRESRPTDSGAAPARLLVDAPAPASAETASSGGGAPESAQQHSRSSSSGFPAASRSVPASPALAFRRIRSSSSVHCLSRRTYAPVSVPFLSLARSLCVRTISVCVPSRHEKPTNSPRNQL
jgi:hypothetical protein